MSASVIFVCVGGGVVAGGLIVAIFIVASGESPKSFLRPPKPPLTSGHKQALKRI